MKCVLLLEHGWCWACYARKRGRGQGHGKVASDPVVKWSPLEAEAMAMKRPDPTSAPAGGSPARDEVLLGWLPELHAHLTEVVWDDGKPRKTTTMMVLTENGVWKAWLHDRDRRVSAWVTGEGWEGLLEAIERSLAADSLEWRKDTR